MTVALAVIDVQNGIVEAGGLTFEQIIAHHNATLDGFDAGKHAVRVRQSDEIAF